MDFVGSSLVTLSQPTGFWETILNAFKNGLGTYILAVIMIALLVRLVFSVVDIISKKINMKTMEINTKMKPELDAAKAKYGNDPAMLQKKTNEIYKKYQFNMMGSCLPMLITMVLQFTVFLTLWNSLQAVSNFNIVSQYQEMKNIYANVLAINNNTQVSSQFEEGDSLKVEIVKTEDGTKKIKVYIINEQEGTNDPVDNITFDNLASDNETLYNNLIYPNAVEIEGEKSLTSLQKAVKAEAERAAQEYYNSTRETFLWIKNVYKAESPSSPMFTESEIKSYISKYYTAEEKENENEVDENGLKNDYEGKIYKAVTNGIDKGGHNGYYILAILAVLTSILSIFLTNLLSRRKGQAPQKQSWAMYVIMPLIMGLFTFMYTSLFAIYIIIGQLVMIALTPLTTFIVKKWADASDKKEKDKNVVEVDYRRK